MEIVNFERFVLENLCQLRRSTNHSQLIGPIVQDISEFLCGLIEVFEGSADFMVRKGLKRVLGNGHSVLGPNQSFERCEVEMFESNFDDVCLKSVQFCFTRLLEGLHRAKELRVVELCENLSEVSNRNNVFMGIIESVKLPAPIYYPSYKENFQMLLENNETIEFEVHWHTQLEKIKNLIESSEIEKEVALYFSAIEFKFKKNTNSEDSKSIVKSEAISKPATPTINQPPQTSCETSMRTYHIACTPKTSPFILESTSFSGDGSLEFYLIEITEKFTVPRNTNHKVKSTSEVKIESKDDASNISKKFNKYVF